MIVLTGSGDGGDPGRDHWLAWEQEGLRLAPDVYIVSLRWRQPDGPPFEVEVELLLRLKTFGTLALLRDGALAGGMRIKRRQLAVLAVLAAEGDGGVSRDRLRSLVWPGAEPENASHSLSEALSRARMECGAELLIDGPASLAIDANILPSDVVDFRHAVSAGDLAGIVAAYSGPFLDDVYIAGSPDFEQWATSKRATFAKDFVAALTKLAEASVLAGDYPAAVDLLRRAAASDPLSGAVTHSLMLALAYAGDQSAALDAARVYAQLVRQELDAAPDPKIVALMEELRAGRPPLPPLVRMPPAKREAPTAPIAVPEPYTPTVTRTGEMAADSAPAIAVMPFAIISKDAGDDYLADGLTEEIISTLMRMRRMRVVPRTTMFAVKGMNADLLKIGRRLVATHMLEGSVRRSGTKLRISARLIGVTDGSNVWQREFDREMGDLFELQDEVARSVADALDLTVMGPSRPPRANVGAETHEFFLRGRYHWNTRRPDRMQTAVECYRTSIARDPKFGLPRAFLAEGYAGMAMYGLMAPQEALPAARDEAATALQLDPGLAEAHNALGYVHAAYEWRWVESAAEFRRALALNAQNDTSMIWYANFCLLPRGRIDEALAELRRARSIDPISSAAVSSVGLTQFFARRYEDAATELRAALRIEPDYLLAHYFLGLALLESGDAPGARAALTRALEVSGGDAQIVAALGVLDIRSGDQAAGEAALARLEAAAPAQYVSSCLAAFLYAALGDVDASVNALQQGAEERASELLWLGLHPWLDPIRHDPRTRELARQVLGST